MRTFGAILHFGLFQSSNVTYQTGYINIFYLDNYYAIGPGALELFRKFSCLPHSEAIAEYCRYDGNLTFNIYPDLEITIPDHQLVVPDIEVNPQGQEGVSNYSTYVEVLINSLQAVNVNDMPRFGRPFLSSAYLLVDNDHQQFTLWASQQSESSDLVEMGPPACRPPVAPPVPTSTPIAAPPPSSSAGSGPSKASIAGSVIGGLAAISLFCGAYLLQKRRRRLQQRRDQALQAGPAIDATYADISACNKAEMPSDRQPPQELPPVRSPGYVHVPCELPQEALHELYELPPALPEKE